MSLLLISFYRKRMLTENKHTLRFSSCMTNRNYFGNCLIQIQKWQLHKGPHFLTTQLFCSRNFLSSCFSFDNQISVWPLGRIAWSCDALPYFPELADKTHPASSACFYRFFSSCGELGQMLALWWPKMPPTGTTTAHGMFYVQTFSDYWSWHIYCVVSTFQAEE